MGAGSFSAEEIAKGGALPTSDKSHPQVALQYAVRGAHCDSSTGSVGCFLDTGARARLSMVLWYAMEAARDSFISALEMLQVEEMLKSDEDLPWYAMLLLDALTAGLAHVVVRGAKALRQGGMRKLDDLSLQYNLKLLEAGHQGAAHWSDVAHDGLGALSDGALETGAKKAGDAGKKVALANLKQVTENATTSYLAELAAATRKSYAVAIPTLFMERNDAELCALLAAFDVTQHSSAMYRQLLEAKVGRFKAAGIDKIGRAHAMRTGGSPGPGRLVDRDTRVVWVQFLGRRQLHLQHHDGQPPNELLKPIHDYVPGNNAPTFGPEQPLTESPELGAPVPAEFVDAAIERHRATWGSEPTVIDKRRAQLDLFRTRDTSPEPAKKPTNPVEDMIRDATRLIGVTNGSQSAVPVLFDDSSASSDRDPG